MINPFTDYANYTEKGIPDHEGELRRLEFTDHPSLRPTLSAESA
jgi:hypothetical protein